MHTKEINSKSIITKSNLPDTDYVVNPYIGCQFGCHYCYASFMGRFVGENISNWGNYVYLKINSIELFKSDLKKIMKRNPNSKILLSSVTDPYHGIESKYKLTRGILAVLVESRYPGLVSILTKSPSVLRDIDYLAKLNNVEVGMTITTTNDQLSKLLENNAPPVSLRIKALKKLKEAQIPTYAFIGPLLPHFRYYPEQLDFLFREIHLANVESVFVEHINMSNYIRASLMPKLSSLPDIHIEMYRKANTDEHKIALDDIVKSLLKKYQLKLRLNQVISH